MPHYLKALGTSDYVNLASYVSIPSNTGYCIELEIQCPSTPSSVARLWGKNGTNSNRCIIFRNAAPTVNGGLANFTTTAAVNLLNRHVYTFERLQGSTISTLYVDGQFMSTIDNGSGISFEWLLTELSATNSRNPVNFYGLKVWIAGVLSHHYDPSASNGTGNILYDTVGGNNGTLTNFSAVDTDKWVYYAGAGDVQAVTSGGSTGRIQTASATSVITHAQQLSSGGISAAIRNAVATSTIVNTTGEAQEVSSGGVANRTAALTATTQADNTQAVVSSATTSSTRNTAATSDFAQAQEISTAGSVAVTRSAVASTQAVNDLSEVQAVSSGGVVTRSTSASALTQITEVQGITTGGTAIAQRNAVASTQAVNDFTVVQAVSSGGVCSVVRDAAAIVQVINHQQFESAGRVSRQLSVYAETVIFDDGYTPEFSIIGLTASVHQQNLSATLNRQKLTAEVRRSTYSANYIQ